MVEFWSECKGLRNSRSDGVSSSPSPGSKAGEDQCLSWKPGRESEFSLTQPLVLSRLSVGWMRPPHWGGQSPLLSLLIQILISSRNSPIDTRE